MQNTLPILLPVRFRTVGSALMAAVFLLPAASHAEYTFWQGGGSSNSWTVAANWQNGTPPNNGTADLFFGESDHPYPNLDVNYSIRSLTFAGGILVDPLFTSYYLGSDANATLTLGAGGLLLTSAGTQSINSNFQLGTDQTWVLLQGTLFFGVGLNTAGHTLSLLPAERRTPISTLDGAITGSGGISAVPSGTGGNLNVSDGGGNLVVLTGTSTYTGATTITGQTLQFNNINALGTTSNVALSGSGELVVGASTTLAKPVSVAGAGTFSAAAGNTLNLTGSLTLGSGATLGFGSSSNTGTVVANFPFSGSPPSAFQISVNAGTLQDGNGTLGIYSRSYSNVGLTVQSGATYDLNGYGLRTNNLQGAGILTSGASATLQVSAGTFSGNLTGALALSKNGTDTLTLSGNNTFSGGTTLSAGTLQIGNGGAGGSLGSGNVTNNANLVFSRSTGLTVANVISGTGIVTQSGGGTTILTGTNTYSGGTTVNAGRLTALDNGNALSSGSMVAIASGATLDLRVTGSDVFQASNTFTGAGTLQKTGTGTLQFGANGGNVNVSLGAGGLIDVQAGTLAGSNSFNGIYTNNLGSLNIAKGAAFDGVEAAVRVNALTGDGTLQGGYGNVGSVTVGVNNGGGTFSGLLQDSGNNGGKLSLVKNGTGTQTLSGQGTFTGTTTVNGGTLSLQRDTLNHGGPLGATNSVTINNGGTLVLSGTNGTTDRINNAASLTLNGGGRFATSGLSEGTAPTAANGSDGAVGLGALTLANTGSTAQAVIEFGNAASGSTLVFTNVAAGKGAYVNILGFTGTANGDGGSSGNDRLLFVNNPGFTLADLANWQFSNDAGNLFATGGRQIAYNGFYEIVPVPEPATWAGGALLLVAAGWGLRRRLMCA